LPAEGKPSVPGTLAILAGAIGLFCISYWLPIECCVNDPVSALTGFRGYPGGLIAAVPIPGSAGFQPAKRNRAGKMPTLPEKRRYFTNTL
jgi:hypothetical protein